jgi:hypothetical protein
MRSAFHWVIADEDRRLVEWGRSEESTMANGKGTWDCHDCKYHFFEKNDGPSPAHCRFWNIRLPREQYGAENLICMQYTTPNGGRLPSQLTLTLDRQFLYAFFYNSDLSDLRSYHPVQRLEGSD